MRRHFRGDAYLIGEADDLVVLFTARSTLNLDMPYGAFFLCEFGNVVELSLEV